VLIACSRRGKKESEDIGKTQATCVHTGSHIMMSNTSSETIVNFKKGRWLTI